MSVNSRTICLFDVDGTLTKSRNPITSDLEAFLLQLKEKVAIGLVGGSDLEKIAEQMSPNGETVDEFVKKYDYVFAENGLVAYKDGSLVGKESILNFMGEEKLQQVINFCLHYMSQLQLPVKRGNFVEFRNGLINVCPVGRSCSQTERDQFNAYDAQHKIREKFVEAIKQKFPDDFGLVYAIGGQISFDVFPKGWDKTYCLKFLKNDYDNIYFFGDKTFPGGNDYEIFIDPSTIGYQVNNPEHTKQILSQLFF